MKTFKEFLNEERIDEIVDYNTMKLTRLRKILGDLQMKKASATTQNKKLQFQNQIGIIKSVIADKEKQEMNESKYRSTKSASQLKVGDVILYGREDTPHEVVSKPEKDIMGHWIKLKNLATKKNVKAWLDADDKIPMNEAVVHNSNNKLQLKAGGSEILITTKGNNVNIFVQEGSERIMFEGKSDDLNAIKDFFSKL